MRILLTGATGQLGASLRERLRADDVVAPTHAELDLADPRKIAAVVRDLCPHLILNTAAYTAVDQAETNTEASHVLNAEAPGALARAAAANGAAVIHYSTDYVFNGSKPTPYEESDPTDPLNVYGRSKLAGEAAVAASGAPHVIFRVCWLYSRIRSNFLLTMLRLGRSQATIAVVNDQTGSPTSAAVIADATVEVLRLGRADLPAFLARNGGIFHLACQGHATWFEFAEAIFAEARAAGLPLNVRDVRPISTAEFPRPARRPSNSRLDLRRVTRQFGIQPQHWRDALHEEVRAVRFATEQKPAETSAKAPSQPGSQ